MSGFDRLVFRGSLRRLNDGFWDRQLSAMVARGMEEYLWQNRILFKDYAAHVKRISERLKQESLRRFAEQKRPIIFLLRSAAANKEQLARRGGRGAGYRKRPGMRHQQSGAESHV